MGCREPTLLRLVCLFTCPLSRAGFLFLAENSVLSGYISPLPCAVLTDPRLHLLPRALSTAVPNEKRLSISPRTHAAGPGTSRLPFLSSFQGMGLTNAHVKSCFFPTARRAAQERATHPLPPHWAGEAVAFLSAARLPARFQRNPADPRLCAPGPQRPGLPFRGTRESESPPLTAQTQRTIPSGVRQTPVRKMPVKRERERERERESATKGTKNTKVNGRIRKRS